MGPIRSKLAGKMGDERQPNTPPMSVVNQVEILIKDAMSYANLVSHRASWSGVALLILYHRSDDVDRVECMLDGQHGCR
jgi:hypothetical protein